MQDLLARRELLKAERVEIVQQLDRANDELRQIKFQQQNVRSLNQQTHNDYRHRRVVARTSKYQVRLTEIKQSISLLNSQIREAEKAHAAARRAEPAGA